MRDPATQRPADRSCSRATIGASLSRDAAGAGRRGHGRRPSAPLLRPGGSRRPPTTARRRTCLDDDPEIAADLAAARAAGTARGRPRRRLGQRRDPGLRDRSPGRRAATIDPAGEPAAAGDRGGGRARRADLRDRTGNAGPRVVRRGPAADRLWHAGRGHGAEPGAVHARVARGGAGHRVGAWSSP